MNLFTPDTLTYLCSPRGQHALQSIEHLPLTAASHLDDITWVRSRYPHYGPALVETIMLRRKAAHKLEGIPNIHQWLLTREALEQATATPVGQYRARRLAHTNSVDTVHDVTCSIGTEPAILHTHNLTVLGSDIDPIRVKLARYNLPTSILIAQADALKPITKTTAVIADPSRRSHGQRHFNVHDYNPPLNQLIEYYQGRPYVIKCGPGIPYSSGELQYFNGEITFVSWKGTLREAALWSPDLAEPHVHRQAIILDTQETITDNDPDDCHHGSVGRWIINPDPSIVRAGLVRHWGYRHNLWQLDPAIAYLTGDHLPPHVRGFEIIEQIDYNQKRLKQTLAAHNCGTLEILVRGVKEVQDSPDRLRQRLCLKGNQSYTVVITRIGVGHHAKAVAFICRASR